MISLADAVVVEHPMQHWRALQAKASFLQQLVCEGRNSRLSLFNTAAREVPAGRTWRNVKDKRKSAVLNKPTSAVAFLVATSPLLGLYGIGVSGFAILDILLLMVNFLLLFLQRFNQKIFLIILGIMFATVISLVVCLITAQDVFVSNMLPRLFKYMNYLVFIGLTVNMVDRQKFAVYFDGFAYIVYGALLLQVGLFFVNGSILVFKIPLLPYVNAQLEALDLSDILFREFRPVSIFVEPAQVAYFTILHFLFTMHFTTERRFLTWSIFLVLIMVIVSSTAFLLYAGLTVIIFHKDLRKHSNWFIASGLLVVCCVVAGVFFYDRILELSSIKRLFLNDGLAITGRVFAGQDTFESFSDLTYLFGRGFNNIEKTTYMNFVSFSIYSFGIIGTGILGFVWLAFLCKNKGTRFNLLLILLPLSVSSPFLLSYYVVLFAYVFCLTESVSHEKKS